MTTLVAEMIQCEIRRGLRGVHLPTGTDMFEHTLVAAGRRQRRRLAHVAAGADVTRYRPTAWSTVARPRTSSAPRHDRGDRRR
jgi:hypothetical protein